MKKRNLKKINKFMDDQLFSEAEAALFLGYSRGSLNGWRSSGKGPDFVKISRTSIRYRLGDLKSWIEKNTVTPKAKG